MSGAKAKSTAAQANATPLSPQSSACAASLFDQSAKQRPTSASVPTLAASA
jgi:hypothetical protein